MLPLISKRYYFVCILFGCGFCILAARIIYLCTYRKDFVKFAETSRNRVVILPAQRGVIMDCKGTCLATQQKVYEVGVDLTQIQDKDRSLLPQLASILNVPLVQLDALWFSPSTCRWKKLKSEVLETNYRKLMGLKIRGVYGNEKQKRLYLHAKSLSHVVGFVNQENVPVGGIEQLMQFYLKGQEGFKAYEVDGKNIEFTQYRKNIIAPKNGYTVELTIDNRIQALVETILQKASNQYHPESMQVLITRPYTGEILAWVNYPYFDSNHYNKYNLEVLKNRIITDVYEPGSVFKVITVSAALDAEVITLNDTFNCELTKASYKDKILPLPNDWKAFSGSMTVPQILSNSSNRGIVQIAFRLGGNQLYRYCKLFGFGASTQTGFAGETRGILKEPKQWDGLTITRLPIGHGIACSLIQMHYAIGAIANGGILFYPQCIQRVYDDSGEIIRTFEPKVRRQVIKPKTAEMMRKILLVSETSKAFIPYYNVTGKTGTTQKIINGHYSHSQHIASFSGFFPNRNPQVQISIVMDSPQVQGIGYGAVVAAPIFKEIAENIITYLEIPPESKLL